MVLVLCAGQFMCTNNESKEMAENKLTSKNFDQHVDNIRHSCAHLLAQAVLELFPHTLLTIGPTTETGFFYDFLPERSFTEKDLPVIEERMHEIAKRDYPIVGGQVPKEAARQQFAHNKFKLELIDGIPGETVGVYSQGPFSDLCKGGHIERTGVLEHFKLTAISGSYWRADRNGQPLQRITGIAFESRKALRQYELQIEEAKKYDHRVVGKQLDLFSFQVESPGAAFFHPRGAKVVQLLIDRIRKELDAGGYQEIRTPLIMHESLWHTSGHYANYKDNMFFTHIDEQTYCVRPMNCPSAVMVYKDSLHSYRDLPLRLSEFGMVHRYELSGVLHGLFRVRTFTQDDGHIFCTIDQIESEVESVLGIADRIYSLFGFQNISYAVSTRPEKSIGTEEQWAKAVAALEGALMSRNVPYTIKEGEGAFYGPKIEILVEDALGRRWQCGTVQVDFCLPTNFGITYVDSDQSRKTPVMIHRAIYGSIERFFGILLEHTKGRLPYWLAPEQVRIVTISEKQTEYAHRVEALLKLARIRVAVDAGSDMISAKIKRAQNYKIPAMLVIGDAEVEGGTVTIRHGDGKQQSGVSLDTLVAVLNETVS